MPLDGLVPIASVTLLVLVVTTLPPASSIATFGWVTNAVAATAPFGCWVNASFAAGPIEIVTEELVAEVRLPSVAVSV